MGFTYRAARERLGDKARIVIAEISDAIVDWAKGPMAAADRRQPVRPAPGSGASAMSLR